MVILPAIDIIDGKCVRLTQGDYESKTVYAEDPVAVAKEFASAGAEWIHIVDLDGAKAGRPVNLEPVQRIAQETALSVEFGGGVRSLEIAQDVLNCGVRRVIFGTRIATDLQFAKHAFSELGEQAVAGVDAKDGVVKVAGWTEGDSVGLYDLLDKLEGVGAKRFIVTDIATDGALKGPNLDLLSKVCHTVSGHVIASGGVSSIADVQALVDLNCANLEGVIVGKAIYEGRVGVAEMLNLVGSKAR